jgi:GTP-binding protein YchF
MSVGIGIVGLPESGRTTIFNALTRGSVDTGSYTPEAPHIGIAKLPDPRLNALADMLKPKRVVPAEVKYIDIGASVKSLATDTIGGEYLSHLSSADALINVARAFINDSIPHIEGSVDAERDITEMELELAYSDLTIIERRLKRVEASLKAAKPDERHSLQHEQELLTRLKAGLEKDIPIREMSLTPEEARAIAGYQFLSSKPLLTVVNIGEEQIAEAKNIEEKLKKQFWRPGHAVIALCGELEMELEQLDDATARQCRQEFCLTEPGLDRAVRLSYELLGLITFFTTASDEVKAWSITSGTDALKAAGKIHTDMERGFIRAEVISYDDLMKAGSIAEGRKHGLLRLEGKHYTVQDGDVITFLFNV